MALKQFKATDFRCLKSVDVEFDAAANLIAGPNAAGKTSVLEAIAYLGRGKSFRGAPTASLIRHGQREFVLLATVVEDRRRQSVGVRNGAQGLEIRIDGDKVGGSATLAATLPLQIIDPDVHDLVGGPPERRRRYLDWLAFHVEPTYLDLWRRFRRALKQRNAALKSNGTDAALDGWDREFVSLAEELAAARGRVFEVARPSLEETAAELLHESIAVDYRRGWPTEQKLAALLRQDRERDRSLGSTQQGPQRADLGLRYDARMARKLVSRGQQKLLASSLVLAATEIAQAALERPMLLLLDDPAAELDAQALSRLMAAVERLGCQVVATALLPDRSLFSRPPALFHVERGRLERQP